MNGRKIENVKTVVLDAQPLIGYFEKEDCWEKVAAYLHEASEERCLLFLTIVNWGEVYYTTLREYGAEYADRVIKTIEHLPIGVVEANKELTLQAARYKARGGMSYADCFAAALAKLRKAELVTGDKEFKVLEKEIKIVWI